MPKAITPPPIQSQSAIGWMITRSVTAVPGGGAIFFNGQAQPLGATVAVSDFYSVINRWVGGAGGHKKAARSAGSVGRR